MKIKITLCSLLFALCLVPAAHANWQYSGTNLGDGWYMDDGSKFIMSVRGGAAFGLGAIKNNIGSLTTEYFVDTTGDVISAAYYDKCVASGGCGDFEYAVLGDISNLPANKSFSTNSFAIGVSLGWTMPNTPQWRIEVGWDHVGESEYNATPLFDGELTLTGGAAEGTVVEAQSASVQSTVNTDIFSIMAIYDFFDGLNKPSHQFIPYFGFGIGYADSKTIMNLADLYGDLSSSLDLQNFGELDQYMVLQFYRSEKSSTNAAGLLALGFSYGVSKNMYLDLGARLTYVPKITWALSNANDTRSRDWFSATNVLYANLMLGIRFEF